MRTTTIALATTLLLSLSGAAMAQSLNSPTGGPTGSNLSNPARAGGAGPQPLNSAGSTTGSVGGVGASPSVGAAPGASMGSPGGVGATSGGSMGGTAGGAGR